MKTFLGSALVVLAFTFPVAALADVSGTNVTLNANQTLNLDTGKTVTSGGDLTWTGSAFNVVGSAKDVDLASTFLSSTLSGMAAYNSLVQSGATLISTYAAALNSSLTNGAITPMANDILIVKTNGGNFAAVLVVAVAAGSSVTIDFDTIGASSSGGGGGTTPSGPTITAVVNNYSYVPAGFPNSGISPGSIMLVFGSGMSQSVSSVFLNGTLSPGLPTTWQGATLSVTVGGKTVTPPIYYATPTQIAAVLPSGTPTGTATITVSYNNQTSNSFQFKVVPSALGLNTYFGSGTGLILAVNSSSGAIYNYTNSAKPGDTILLFGSGLGADTADSDTVYTTSPHAVSTPIQIYFGGVAGNVQYAGSSGYPGYNQINVTIPSSAPTDCYVGVVAVTGSGGNAVSSNFGSIPISASGGQCTNSIFGTSGTSISSLSSQATVKSGAVFVAQSVGPKSSTDNTPVTSNIAFASFQKETGASYSSDASNGGSAFAVGSCYVTEVISTTGGVPTVTGLDAGAITLTGPNGMYTLSKFLTGFYTAMLPTNAITSSGGAFTFNGAGGADVGSFSTTLNLPNPILTWTNESSDATVNRSSGVTVNWTGGAAGSYVLISGNSTDQNTGANGSFTCIANQSALSFAVPNYITGALPAGSGELSVSNDAGFGTFKASGLDIGISFAYTGTTINATYQ